MNVSSSVAAAQPASFADMKELFGQRIKKMESQNPEKVKEMKAFGAKVEALTKQGTGLKEAVLTARKEAGMTKNPDIDRAHQDRLSGPRLRPIPKQDSDVDLTASRADRASDSVSSAELLDPSIYGSRSMGNNLNGLGIGIWTQGGDLNGLGIGIWAQESKSDVSDGALSSTENDPMPSVKDMRASIISNLYGSRSTNQTSLGKALIELLG